MRTDKDIRKHRESHEKETLCVGYLRLSPRDPEDPRVGLQAQHDAIEAWARAQGVRIVLWATDRDVSGDSAERPALAKALDYVRKGDASVVVVARRDRLARDALVAAILTRAVKKAGGVVRSADGIGAGDSAADDLVTAVVDAASAYELRRIRERTKEALQAKIRRGEAVSYRLPYGYRRAKDGKHLEEDPGEQAILAYARQLRAQGYTWAAIARALFEGGYANRHGHMINSRDLREMVERPPHPTLASMRYQARRAG